MLFLITHPSLKNMWNSSIFRYLMTLCRYLHWENTEGLVDSSLVYSTLIFNSIIFAVYLLVFGLFIQNKGYVSGFSTFLIRVLSVYSIAFTTVLVVPLIEVNIFAIFCTPSDVTLSRLSLTELTFARARIGL